MLSVEAQDLVEEDAREKGIGADGARVVEQASADVVGIAAEDLRVAGGDAGPGLDAEEDRDVLVRVEAVGDEEWDDDDDEDDDDDDLDDEDDEDREEY